MQNQIPSSTGGVITFTTTGLRHSAGNNYAAAHAPAEISMSVKTLKKAKLPKV